MRPSRLKADSLDSWILFAGRWCRVGENGSRLCTGPDSPIHTPLHCSLVTDFPQGVWECREPQLGLEELLRARCQLLQDQEEFQVWVQSGERKGVSWSEW